MRADADDGEKKKVERLKLFAFSLKNDCWSCSSIPLPKKIIVIIMRKMIIMMIIVITIIKLAFRF